MSAVIDDLVAQYAEQAAFLWTQRARAVIGAAHDLESLADRDERLAAHLEGLHASGAAGWRHARSALQATPEAGEAFTAAVLALETADTAGFDLVLEVADASPAAVPGIASAVGWVPPSCLRGVVHDLLRQPGEARRLVGLAACAHHRVDPSGAWGPLAADPSPRVRARALRLAGEVGATSHLATCLARAADDPDADCRREAAWSAVLLGDRGAGLAALQREAAARPRSPAFDLALQACAPAEGQAWLRRLAGQGLDLRALLRGGARIGDPAYVPWLIHQMGDPALARIAGESFALITGADLQRRPLRGPAPAGAASGPSDDPDDPSVATDPDADLPWPDAAAVSAWWASHRERFPAGRACLLGAPLDAAQAMHVLATGRQRARALAATALALRSPGQPLFDVRAPARRQQEALAAKAMPPRVSP